MKKIVRNIIYLLQMNKFTYLVSLYIFAFVFPKKSLSSARRILIIFPNSQLLLFLKFIMLQVKLRPFYLKAIVSIRDMNKECWDFVDLNRSRLQEVYSSPKLLASQKKMFYFDMFDLSKSESEIRLMILQRFEEFKILYDQALKNWTSYLYDSNKFAVNLMNNDVRMISKEEEKSLAVITIPFHFFSYEKFDKTFQDICSFYLAVLRSIATLDCYIVPELQFSFFWYPNGKNTLTYHTVEEGSHVGLRFKESAFKGFFTLDEVGYSGWHSSNRNTFLDEINEFSSDLIDKSFIEISHKYINSKESKYDQEIKICDLPDNYIFLSLQTVEDLVSNLAYIKTEQLLSDMVDICQRNSKTLVVKRHPKCRNHIIEMKLKKYSKLQNVIVTDGDIHKLIKGASAVVCTNSGVGFESLMYLKTVITTGKSDYEQATLVAKDKKDLEYFIGKNIYVDIEKIKKFVFWFFNKHLYRNVDHLEITKKIQTFLNYPIGSGEN